MRSSYVCHWPPQSCLWEDEANVKDFVTCAQPFPDRLWGLLLLVIAIAAIN